MKGSVCETHKGRVVESWSNAVVFLGGVLFLQAPILTLLIAVSQALGRNGGGFWLSVELDSACHQLEKEEKFEKKK